MTTNKAAQSEVHRTLEYDFSHGWAIFFLPIGLIVCCFGLYMLTPLDGSQVQDRAHAWLAIALGSFFALVGLAALRRPNEPGLTISIEGITYLAVSRQTIPWSEIQGVETVTFVPHKRFFSRKATAILLSEEFYRKIDGGYYGLYDQVDLGSPVSIRILHYEIGVPLGELYEAVVLRWQVFGNPQQNAIPAQRGAGPFARARAAAAARAAAFGDVKALRPLRPAVSPVRFWLSLAPLLGIIVLLANQAGLWSTQAQRDARAAAKLQAEKLAEMRNFGEEATRRADALRKASEKSWLEMDASMRRFAERERQAALEPRAFAVPPPAQQGGHREAVLALAVTPDGRSVVSAGGDHAVKLWELARPGVTRNLGAHKGIVRSVHVVDDGTHVLSAGDDGDIVLRAVSDGRVLHVLRERGRGDIAALAVSADGGRAVSVYDKGGGDVWSLSSRIRLQELDSGGMRLQAVAVSREGRRVLGGGADGMLRLWDMESGTLLRSFGSHQGPAYAVAFLPDGRRAVSGGGDSTMRLWDVETGAELRSFAGHTDTVYSVAVSGDGKRILSGSLDRTARLWDPDTGSEVARFGGHQGPVYSVAFTKDGVLTGSGDRSIRLWNANGGEPAQVFAGGERLDR